jgi:uncharacterized protein
MELIFEWDRNKASANLRKHKVSFDEAKTIFADELLVTFPDEIHSENEERFISIGTSANSRILLLVHTENDFIENKIVIRIISCRKATNLERKIYEQ